MNITETALQEMLTLLLAMTTTGHDDWTHEHTEILVTIGKGMFWSEEFDQRARSLAKEINSEFDYIAGAGK